MEGAARRLDELGEGGERLVWGWRFYDIGLPWKSFQLGLATRPTRERRLPVKAGEAGYISLEGGRIARRCFWLSTFYEHRTD
jgi:hypothetical protein